MTSKRLYLIDDEAVVRASIVSLLQVDGVWDHVEFATADDFLEALAGLSPGCVLVDLQLPGSSGSVVVEALATGPQRFPFIVVTGFSDFSTAVHMFRRGAVDFLHKPFDPVALIDALDRALHRLQYGGERREVAEDVRQRIAGLSEDERRLMALVFEGASNAEIAIELHADPRDVQRARAMVLAKIGAPSIFDAMRVFALAGAL